MGKNWKNFELRDRKGLDHTLKRLLVEIMDIKDSFGEDSEGSEGDSTEYFSHLREFHIMNNAGRNMNTKGAFGKTSCGNKHVIG